MGKLAKRKILLIQPSLQPPGGGNAVAVWMLETLKHDYCVTTLTWTPVEVASINHYYGVSLRHSDFRALSPPKWIRSVYGLIKSDIFDIHGFGLVMRWCKIIKNGYDIIMSANDETDFGKKGLQYIHYPYAEYRWQQEPKFSNGSSWHRTTFDLLKLHIRPWRLISGFSYHRMRENLTLVNSDWTGNQFYKFYKKKAITLNPPVVGDFFEVPWHQKESGFVCIGRIVEAKRIIEIIDILFNVRKHFPDIHLHIIGAKVNWAEDYYDQTKQKIAENESWISLEEDISRSEIVDLVCRHRYGIHGKTDEHFGMAVAELVSGGCITFVPNSGGQMEIVGEEPRLVYDSSKDAVVKILHVLQEESSQTALRQYLESRRNLFTAERFVKRLREIVGEFVNE